MRVVSKSSSLMDIMAEVSEMSVASWSSKRPTEQVHLLAKLKSESARKRRQVVSNERSLYQIVACLKPLGVSEPSSWSALISRIAGCGPACPVVWEGASARRLPIPIDYLWESLITCKRLDLGMQPDSTSRSVDTAFLQKRSDRRNSSCS